MFYLEEWIHQIVRNVLGTGRVTRADLNRYRLLCLRQAVQYAFERSSFYRERFKEAGIDPEKIRSLEDLSEIPLTEPRHLAESPYRFLCISQAEVARPHSFVTSGTTGPQKKVFWSHGDLARIVEFMAAGIATVAGPEDVVQIMLADGRPYSQADLLYRGVNKIGATPVLSGVGLSPEEQLREIENSHSTVLFGYTNRLFRMSKELQRQRDLRAAGVKVLFLAGEYLPDAMRRQLEDIWNCRTRTHYGLTEMGLGVAVECEAGRGYHFNEAGLLLEIVNPRTGETVPAGEEGELVFTTLTREAMPLIRYRTHDISRLMTDPCPCGAATLSRIDNIRKRLESVVILDGGDEIYSSLFDDVLFEVSGLIDYQAALTKHEGKDRLEFRVEMPDSGKALQEIYRKLHSLPVIAKNITAGRMADPKVLRTDKGELQSVGREKKLIVDSR